MEGDLCHGRGDQLHCFFCPIFFVSVDPGTLFTNVGHLKKVRIEAGGSNSISIGIFVHSWRTGSNYDPIDTKISDVIFNEILTRIGTHILIISGNGDMGKGLGEYRYLLNIPGRCNIDPTMTDIYTDLHHFIAWRMAQTELFFNSELMTPNSELWGSFLWQGGRRLRRLHHSPGPRHLECLWAPDNIPQERFLPLSS